MRFMLRLISGLWARQSLMRIYLNESLRTMTLSGRVIDLGVGGTTSYLDFVPRASGTVIEYIDPKQGRAVDFETDTLPHEAHTFSQVVLLNVLEHIFSYDHLIGETYRILAPNGTLIGFTPFLVRYHQDPHDFFRYTHEALERILIRAHFKTIVVTPVGEGPFMAGLNIFILSIPRPVRIIASCVALALDRLFIKVRPRARSIYPMGYLFVAHK